MNIFTRVKDFILAPLKPKAPKPTGRIIRAWEHRSFGNCITYRESIGWYCWLTPRPRVGDELRFEVEGGQVLGRLIQYVDYCKDPEDMAFFSLWYGSDPISTFKNREEEKKHE